MRTGWVLCAALAVLLACASAREAPGEPTRLPLARLQLLGSPRGRRPAREYDFRLPPQPRPTSRCRRPRAARLLLGGERSPSCTLCCGFRWLQVASRLPCRAGALALALTTPPPGPPLAHLQAKAKAKASCTGSALFCDAQADAKAKASCEWEGGGALAGAPWAPPGGLRRPPGAAACTCLRLPQICADNPRSPPPPTPPHPTSPHHPATPPPPAQATLVASPGPPAGHPPGRPPTTASQRCAAGGASPLHPLPAAPRGGSCWLAHGKPCCVQGLPQA